MSEQVARRTGVSARALASLALFCAGAWLVPSGIGLHVALDEWLGHSGIARRVASHDGDTGLPLEDVICNWVLRAAWRTYTPSANVAT